MRFLLVLAAVLSLLGYQVGVAKGFQLGVDVTAKRTTTRSNNVLSKLHASSSPGNYLLDEFKTASGELVDPYKILKISRDAERTEIRQQYLTFSKKYHPDGAKHRDVLPGNCNNADDVREQWERIKLSYEILSDKKTRTRYDRHAFLSDPSKAVQEAAVNAIGKSISTAFSAAGKGVFKIGSLAVDMVANNEKK